MPLTESRNPLAVQPTMLDRLVMNFFPRHGLRRMQARTVLAAAGFSNGGYEGGRRARRGTKRWRPFESSADADILPDLGDLRGRSRDLARNVPIATGAVSTKVTNVVGTGLQLQASIDHEALGLTDEQADTMEREQEREWCVFCRTSDFNRVQELDEQAPLAYRATTESGDCFIIRRYRKDPGDLYGTKLQILEADRVRNPYLQADGYTIADGNILSGGIEVNADGMHVAYWVTDKHPGALRPGALKWERVAARTADGAQVVIHVYDRVRPEQTRGVPYLAPVIELVKQLGDYTDAEVRAAVLTSFVTWFVKTDLPEDPDGQKPILGERDSSLDPNEVKLGSGALVDLAPGEDVVAPSLSRPNPQFDPFLLAITRHIGAALGIGQELLIKHFTASYSASRAALEMAWQYFRAERMFLTRRFYQPVYEWMMDEAVASGRLNRPGYFEDPILREAYLGANWIGPSKISLDPLKEANADEVDMTNGVKTGEQVCLERTGGEIEKKIAQLGKEKKMRDEAGLVPVVAVATGQKGQPNQTSAPAGGGNANNSSSDYENESAAAGGMR